MRLLELARVGINAMRRTARLVCGRARQRRPGHYAGYLESLPREHHSADALAFFLHDVLLQALQSGTRDEVFNVTVPLHDDADLEALHRATHVFEWMAERGEHAKIAQVTIRSLIQCLLGDFSHFAFESLMNARKRKLSVAVALARKPFQETLLLLEHFVGDPEFFLQTWAVDPMTLRAKNAGGVSGHTKRIARALEATGSTAFDAEFLATLRFSKASDDSLDLFWNRALHLITEHERLRTEPFDFNLIGMVPGSRSFDTNLRYFYSRVPYVMAYARVLFEHLLSTWCAQTEPKYLDEVELRCFGAKARWFADVQDDYRHPALAKWVSSGRDVGSLPSPA